jgi:hypothetical protein
LDSKRRNSLCAADAGYFAVRRFAFGAPADVARGRLTTERLIVVDVPRDVLRPVLRAFASSFAARAVATLPFGAERA